MKQTAMELSNTNNLSPSFYKKFQHSLVLSQAGSILLGENKFSEALPYLDAALALNPKNAHALTFRGEVLRQLKSPLHALDDLDAALAINPENPYALMCQAKALKEVKQFTQALQKFDKVIHTLSEKQEVLKHSSIEKSVTVSNSQMGFFKGKVVKSNNQSPAKEPNANQMEPFGNK